jgi:hypothetical protein
MLIIIGLGLIGSIFIFFYIPDKPSIALIFGTILILGSFAGRVVVWIFWQ